MRCKARIRRNSRRPKVHVVETWVWRSEHRNRESLRLYGVPWPWTTESLTTMR